ncbi:MAG TPA: glycosyltransferase family 2 protein [Patescibacteria group bacterium]|nr:glycosyltransferase family 2 protein [Patescibacteria group bacterium]
MGKISVVINTLNEAKNLPQAIASIKNLASEIVVVDMESDDETVEIAKKLGARVFGHKRVGYVEPARNFAISKASGDWILILDADEEISPDLAKEIKDIVNSHQADYYRIPRKNIIFGHFMKHSRWWPDYNIRFFKKGFVSWNEIIHGVPVTKGVGNDVKDSEDLAIIHHHHKDIDSYLERMIRYSKIQSEELVKNGYIFYWPDLITKPTNEFLSRYFAGQGYKDGIHGLAISLLQSMSELIIYVRVWGSEGYQEKEISKEDVNKIFNKNIHDLIWWIRKEFSWLRFRKFW